MQQLEQIKFDLEQRLQALEKRIRTINADISHLDQPLSSDWSEQALERENDEVLEALGNASKNEIAQIKRALQRIDAGTYRECEICGETIPLERLKLIPYTIHCTRCAEELETSQRNRH